MSTDIEKWTGIMTDVMKDYSKLLVQDIMINSPDPEKRRLTAIASEDPDRMERMYDTEEGQQLLRQFVQEKVIPQLQSSGNRELIIESSNAECYTQQSLPLSLDTRKGESSNEENNRDNL